MKRIREIYKKILSIVFYNPTRMSVNCAWCNKQLVYGSIKNVSHGMCVKCFEKNMKELEKKFPKS